MTHETQTQLEREIREQPDVLARRAEPGWVTAREAAQRLRAGEVTHIVIAARGSSDNAARYAQYLFGLEARLPVGLATPWLYEDERPPLLAGAGVIGISQSGQSPDVIAVVRAAREQARPAIALTNDPGSPLAQAADVVVPMLAGPERSVAATKTYLASLHAIAQISAVLGDAVAERRASLELAPERLAALIAEQLEGRARFDRLAGVRALTVVGRGLQLATAFETALKLRELSGLPGEAFSLPDLLHGPVAALRAGGAVWVLSVGQRLQPGGAEFAQLQGLAGLGVAVSDDAQVRGAADIAVELAADVQPWLAPLLAIIPAQAAALRLAELGDGDVDRPDGLTKVTLTH